MSTITTPDYFLEGIFRLYVRRQNHAESGLLEVQRWTWESQEFRHLELTGQSSREERIPKRENARNLQRVYLNYLLENLHVCEETKERKNNSQSD